MLPYFEQPSLDLGLVTIHAFGVMVAAALLLGMEIFKRRVERTGLSIEVGNRLLVWIVVAGLAGAHLVDRLFYNLDETLANPVSLLIFWKGISSFGGLLGGALGAWLFFRRSPKPEHTWRYLDATAYAIPFAWLVGRIGCFLAYDHVGVTTDFFLGQEYRDGLVRHNLGLEEALYWLPVAVAMWFLGRQQHRPGLLVGMLAVMYAPGRFLLDFLRVSDAEAFGLIVSQYASIFAFVLGIWVLWRAHEPATPAPRAKKSTRS